MTKRKIFWGRIFRAALPLLLTLLWLGFIFGNSLRDGVESGNQSHSAQEIMNAVFHFFGMENPIGEGLLRKLAHFGEFAVLAVLYIGDWLGFGWLSLAHSLKAALPRLCSAVPFCFLCACADEFLQRFSAGRAPQFSDVLIDTSGALVATLLCLGVFFVFRHVKRKREKTEISSDRFLYLDK